MSVGGSTCWATKAPRIMTGKTPITRAAIQSHPRAPNPYMITPVRQKFRRPSRRLYARGVRRLQPHHGQENGLPNRISAHLSRLAQFGQSKPAGSSAMIFISAQDGAACGLGSMTQPFPKTARYTRLECRRAVTSEMFMDTDEARTIVREQLMDYRRRPYVELRQLVDVDLPTVVIKGASGTEYQS